jgi:alcohol dehydrogenase class IV
VPETIIYDVDLSVPLPPRLSVASGMNALAHAVEGLYARDGNPILSLMAEEGIRALGSALPRIAISPGDRAARRDALYGAWLCGTVLAGTAMAIHHKLCHVLGGMYDLPHAELHAALLPYTAAFLLPAAPEAGRRIAEALGAADPAAAIGALARDVGTPSSLAALGLTEDDAVHAAAVAAPDLPERPRRPTPAELEDLLRRAVRGAPA